LNILATYSKPLPPRDGKRGTDSRFEDVVTLSAEYCERIADAEGTKELPSFASLEIPDFKYFPTLLMDKQGPKQWARFRLLQACERLKISSELWPRFKDLDIPRQQYSHTQQIAQSFSVPAFHRLYESESEWRERAHGELDLFLDKFAHEFDVWFKQQIDDGHVSKIKPTRDTSPLELRYEWAAQRYCLGKQFKEMASATYSPERIRKAVRAIFKEADLRDRK
jgi:hypothetical protein